LRQVGISNSTFQETTPSRHKALYVSHNYIKVPSDRPVRESGSFQNGAVPTLKQAYGMSMFCKWHYWVSIRMSCLTGQANTGSLDFVICTCCFVLHRVSGCTDTWT